MTSSIRTKPVSLIFGIVAFFVLLAIAVGLVFKPSQEADIPSTKAEPGASAQSNSPTNAGTGTVAAVWQGQTVADAAAEHEQTSGSDTIPFSADALYEALQNVRIDNNGEVVLDNQALEALNHTLQYGEVTLSDQNLEILQELIKIGVPGKAGEQTADIVVDYYRYLGAKDEFTAMTQASPNELTPDDYRQQYKELQALRDLYLGEEVASKLFAETDANARYMFKAQQLEADASLSSDEKAEQLNALNNELTDATVPVDNWRQRYDAFLEEKQRIVNAGLAEQSKQEQIQRLMQQHFSAEELDKVQYLEIGSF